MTRCEKKSKVKTIIRRLLDFDKMYTTDMRQLRPILFLALILCCGRVTCACICDQTVLPSQGFTHAQAVFTGKVINSGKGRWTVLVMSVWKGDVDEVISLRDDSVGTSCASNFKVGNEYLFLADVKRAGKQILYYPQVCNWTIQTRSHKLDLGSGDMWVEDLVLKDRGSGSPPTSTKKRS